MNDSIVLCYHAVSPTWEAELSTTPTRFERQIALLAHRGYEGVRFSEAVRTRPPGRVVAVTFDDAYRSVLELARPILDRFGMPGTVFAPTDGVQAGVPLSWPGIDQWHGGPHEQELMPMSWTELRGLAEAGWEIGSHTVSHPHLTHLDDASLDEELTRSKAACELQIARPCASLAYPYGDLDDRVVAAAARAGYETGAALPRRLNSRAALEWPRTGVYRADGDRRFRVKISPAMRRLRSSAAWEWLDRPRRLAGSVRD